MWGAAKLIAFELLVSHVATWGKRSLMTIASGGHATDSFDNNTRHPPRKDYAATVCIVPHESDVLAWERVGQARRELKDPGLFRWPPHINLLYPFVSFDARSGLALRDLAGNLSCAAAHHLPFNLRMSSLGCFGSRKRGVLWLKPECCQRTTFAGRPDCDPLIEMQKSLQGAYPMCDDQWKHGGFTPHMTLSHFQSKDDALAAKAAIESWWPDDTEITISEIYLLKRDGDDGQFLRLATICEQSPLNPNGFVLHDPPSPFLGMPTVEEDWVREERMKLKQRRNRKSRRRRRSGSQRDCRPPSAADCSDQL